ncbi:MAG: bifunctional UDP-N-acetylglucosamine diphosphorylase/glucosamine-1-phosphate N-acetyltransferase GlmU [Bdellovibrionales bacterium]
MTQTSKNPGPRLTAIVLAGGKGTRMKSPLPKVLHPVAGVPMILRAVKALQGAGTSEIRLVVGHGQGLVRQVLESTGVQFFEQKEQLGTAHAVSCAQVDSLEGEVLIMNGDHPLITTEDIKNLVESFRELKADVAVVTAIVKKPGDLGRIIRQKNQLRAIVEAKDASADTLKIREINTGLYIVKATLLQELLPKIKNENSKKEYYLTDLILLALEAGKSVQALRTSSRVAHGVNQQSELAMATRYVFKKKAQKLMEEGVLIMNPSAVYIEEAVEVGAGSVIYPHVFLRGKTKIGSFCVLEPQVFISDSTLGQSVQVRQGSYLEKAEVHNNCSVGPYARLRPETVLMDEVHIGNFVELKKTKMGKRSKAAHLTYLGDAEIGEDCNIGCGAITVNYSADKQKHKTKIGNRTFVGSDVQLIAPIEVGDDVILGAGSVITKSVPDKALAVARSKQTVIPNYREKKNKTSSSQNEEN